MISVSVISSFRTPQPVKIPRLFVTFWDMSQKAIDTTGSGPRSCGVGPMKVGIGSDSTVYVLKWKPKQLMYDVPKGEISYLCAREEKLTAMAQSVEYSKHWPLVVRHIDGVLNSYADLLSRAADQLHVLRMQRSTHDVLALPVRVHLYKAETPSKTQSGLITLNITATEKVTVIAAYKADTTVYKKVRMLDICNILTGNSSDMQRTVVDRVQAWGQKRFTVSDDILYTSASYYTQAA